jgi:bifunctional UDP-N-acetylglucosamine pyrophosphorylase/glucosamine-1-phosphate N-acetyltransferase
MATNVVILAAGLGTRMRSKKAKVLHRAGGLTLIEHVIRAARAVAPPERMVAVVGHQAAEVARVVQPLGVATALQTEQKGTGHAVRMARDLLAGREGLLVTLYGDVPFLSGETLRRLVAEHQQSGRAGTVITCELDDPAAYGRIVRNASGDIQAIVEYKAATPEQRAIREINSGIYCFDNALVWRHIDEITTNNPAGEYYLTDLVEILNRHGHRVGAMQIEDFSELLGINTRVELAEIDRLFRARKARELMLAGVTIELPETVVIDLDVQVGQDTVIEPYTRLTGRTVIGEDCHIQTCSVIEDSTVGDGSRVGPFARLRQGAELAPRVHIGNFVELKKTRMGAGAKANHLAYLGDAEIGAKSNIGAGTITCNYDGKLKHRTQIGEEAFIGSNATLVAPIEIADRAYIAAGSTITDAVPADSLALGRARQTTKPGWKPKWRQEK